MTLTAIAAGTVALALTPLIRRFAGPGLGQLFGWSHVLLAVVGGAGAAIIADSWAEALAFSVLAVACAVLVVIDVAVHRLPDIIVGPTYPALFAALAVAAWTGNGPGESLAGRFGGVGDWGDFGRAAVAAVAVVAAYFVLALISPAGLGLGDVKFSGLLGAFLGWHGWSQVLIGTLAAFSINAVVALVVLAVTRRPRARETVPRDGASTAREQVVAARTREVPFGPSMVAGAVVAVVAAEVFGAFG
jgi:leader peptidase (prepilin peptidase) / N-methyltransferase